MAAASVLLALTLLLVVAAFLVLPLLQQSQSADEVTQTELLTEQRELVLRALAELELDNAEQKLDPADHAHQRALLLQAGAALLQQLDALAAAPDVTAQLEQEVARLRRAGRDAH